MPQSIGTALGEIERAGVSGPFTQPKLNFVQGSNITLTVADDAANDRVNVTISGSAGGFNTKDAARNAVNGTNTFVTNLSLNSGGTGLGSSAYVTLAAGVINGTNGAGDNDYFLVGMYEHFDPSGVFIGINTSFDTYGGGQGATHILGHPDGTLFGVDTSGGGGNPAINRTSGSSSFSGMGMLLRLS